jgi:hypothetical protein
MPFTNPMPSFHYFLVHDGNLAGRAAEMIKPSLSQKRKALIKEGAWDELKISSGKREAEFFMLVMRQFCFGEHLM